MLPHVTSMIIDEDKHFTLTNYTQVKKGFKAVDSDHVPLELNLNLKIFPTKPTRVVIYNFKDERARNIFQNSTTFTKEFTNSFRSNESIQGQCENWKKLLEKHVKNLFLKIKIRSHKISKSKADNMMKERNILKKKHDVDEITKEEAIKLDKLEKNIAKILSEEGFEEPKSLRNTVSKMVLLV